MFQKLDYHQHQNHHHLFYLIIINHYLINEEYNVDTIDEKSQIEDFENLDNTILDFSESNPFGDAGKES